MEVVDQLNNRFHCNCKFQLQRKMGTFYPQIVSVGRILCKVMYITL
jgi:hypothetical protein